MPEGSRLEDRVRSRRAAIESAGLLRTLSAPSGIDLSSNDYLNLATHPEVVRRFLEGVRREGCGSTGSRLLRGQRAAFDAIERRFARFKGTERALLFSSAYLANLAVMATLVEPADTVFSDEANHASLIDGIRLSRARAVVFPHNDVSRLRELMQTACGVRPGRVQFVVVESLFSMEGDTAPLGEYRALCRSTGATLVVDEAHAVGVHGPAGAGLLGTVETAGETCVSINAAGKALGAAGAFVAGPEWLIEDLIQRARPLAFSTALPPALSDALEGSLDVLAAEPERRQRLLARAAYLRAELASAGVEVPAGWSQIVPVVVGDNDRAMLVASRLRAEGFDVRAIRPPSVPVGTARLRISVNAGLTESTLHRFAGRLAAALREAGVCSVASS
jgi:8-amino-7-oxononanoate synthase